MSNVVEVDDANFEAEVLKSQVLVLLDFSAEWCAPCKRLDPVVRELAREYGERLKVAHLDIDRSQDIAMRYGIMSVPTVLFVKEGRVRDQHLGFAPREKLVEKIAPLL